MKSTLIRPDGTRLVIESSPLFGAVRLYVLGSKEVVAIPLEMVAAVVQALEMAATMIEESSLPRLEPGLRTQFTEAEFRLYAATIQARELEAAALSFPGPLRAVL